MKPLHWIVLMIWLVAVWFGALAQGISIGKNLQPTVTQVHKCPILFEPWREISRTNTGTHEIWRCRRIK